MSRSKKRNLTIGGILLILLLCVASLATFNGLGVAAQAASTPSLDSIIYTDPSAFQFTAINSTECSVKLIDKSIKNAKVPKTAKIDGVDYTVTEVVTNGFSSTPGLKTVVLPKTVRKLNSAAFQNCKDLELVYAPQVKDIGASCFAMCPALKDFIFPATVETVGASVFLLSTTKVHARFDAPQSGWASNWNSGNAIQIQDHDYNQRDTEGYLWRHGLIYEEIEQASPLSMTSLTTTSTTKILSTRQANTENINHGHVTVPASDLDIKPGVFEGEYDSIIVLGGPDSINIWSYAFANLKVNQGITINREVTYDCGWIHSDSIMVFNSLDTPFITLPTPQKILEMMFFDSKMKNINFSTPTGTIYENTGVVTIPDSIQEIRNNAFDSMSNIKHLYVPTNIAEIGNQAFNQWNNTQTIHMPFFSEEQAKAKLGTGWKTDNFAKIEYIGEISVISQPTEIRDENTYKVVFEFKIPKNYSFDDFTYAGTYLVILTTTLKSTTDSIVGDYKIRRWEYDVKLNSAYLGGVQYYLTREVYKDGKLVLSARTNDIKVHIFLRSSSDFMDSYFDKSSYYTKYDFYLMADINLGTFTWPRTTKAILDINKGNIYGNNHTVTYAINIPANANNPFKLGLFTENWGIISGLKVNASLTITNYVTTGWLMFGGITCLNDWDATIENCEVTINANNNSATWLEIGGIACENYSGYIRNCTTKGSIVNGKHYLAGSGGIVYSSNMYAEITGCTNKATISGYANMGGIAAYNSATISSCTNEGNLTLNYYLPDYDLSIGGIVGINTQGTCTYNKNTGTIKFGQWVSCTRQPNMGIIIGTSEYNGIIGMNTLGGSMDLTNLPTANRTYAGYRETGRVK